MNVNVLILFKKPTNPIENQAEEMSRRCMQAKYKRLNVLTGIQIPSQPEDLKIRLPKYYLYQVDNKVHLF